MSSDSENTQLYLQEVEDNEPTSSTNIVARKSNDFNQTLADADDDIEEDEEQEAKKTRGSNRDYEKIITFSDYESTLHHMKETVTTYHYRYLFCLACRFSRMFII